MTLVKQAEFAAMCEVSRKTVTKWKSEGRLVLQGNLVDVEATDDRMRRLRRDGSPVRKGAAKVVTPAVTQAATVTNEGNKSGAKAAEGNKSSAPVTLSVGDVRERLEALDWTQRFDWSEAAMNDRARLAARCIGWEAVTSPVRDDGHWGCFQLRIPEFIGAVGELHADGVAAGFGFELDAWDVIKTCREELQVLSDEGEMVEVRLDLLPLLGHPFSEHEERRRSG